ncbi:MAG: bifunctional (p)ppGpp synthetase/guanosine-3',5'-bis(diphosphate) 3'-pyrophosphohydrolase [Acidiferrobacterales bacterium]|nr:bifunctional (p)ppGpp synthetase/guanosine-3',5'-bis(diphosphate) 3'-pyrophosphohydrolase [Acidiferrobacterales bacterium]
MAKNVAKRIFSQSPEKAMRAVCKGRLASYLPGDAINDIFKAYQFSEKAHRGQIRRTGEHYIFHPIAVADTLAELQMDTFSIMAALLHDVIEDTPVSKTEIEERFGEDVANLVDGVSKIGQIKFDSREHAEAENFRKMLMAMSEDVRVMIIKLADRLHNMRTMSVMEAEQQKRISRQTLEIYAPIAERLGLYQWARELQDLCFRYLYPKRHHAISKALMDREGNRKQIVENLRKSISDTMSGAGIADFSVKGRRKSVFSIYKKMLKKRRSFKELHDIYGFRVIVDKVDDCYRTLGVIHNAYKPIPGRFVDYIAIPKTNGYQSLHTVVFGPYGDNIEVQIRTQEMDKIAEAGVAAHWVYKSDNEDIENSSHLARQWLLDLLDPAHHGGNPVEFLEHLKADLYPDEVYVFTPKGDIKKMPRGSTALDFAYAVHSDVGMHCAGARINHALATLPTILQNGDRVEIITSRRALPNTAWLNYAVTARARTHIRNYLKHQTNDDALKLGKRLLAGAVKQRLFARRKITKEIQTQLLEDLNLETWPELLIDIGLGVRLPDMVARQIAQISGEVDEQGKEIGEEALVIKGSEGLLITYSRCCYPIPGDTILGTFTAGHGLVVHTSDCPNISELRKQPERSLMVDWDENINKDFHVKLQVRVKHVSGAFAKVASAIAENGSNINHVDTHEGADEIRQVDFNIDVKSRQHLATIIKAIRKLTVVEKVLRQKG